MPKVQKERKTAAERYALPSKESPRAESMTGDVLVKCDLSVGFDLKHTDTQPALRHFSTSSQQTSSTVITSICANIEVSDGQESDSELELECPHGSIDFNDTFGYCTRCITTGMLRKILPPDSDDEDASNPIWHVVVPEGAYKPNPPRFRTRTADAFRSQRWVADRIVTILTRCGVQCALVDDMANAVFSMNDHKCENIAIAVYPSDGTSTLQLDDLLQRVVEEDPTCFTRHGKKPHETQLTQLFCNPPEALRKTLDFEFFVTKTTKKSRCSLGYKVQLVVPTGPNSTLLPQSPAQHIVWIDGLPVISFAYTLLRQLHHWHMAYRSTPRGLTQSNRANVLLLLLSNTAYIEPLRIAAPWTSQPPLIPSLLIASVKQQIAAFIKSSAGASTRKDWIKLGLA
ncbi:hypothetical protein CVT24_000347 [Panaeolus cyanescens]|uniref:Uncharacterized protein n=1 Tax=Panaeolus cyanescens TaxID=181874 RepID=A0A409WSP8_9AGAR|nr:hypothetical protein CVT24_000347 [Panaeolus cyanescens]